MKIRFFSLTLIFRGLRLLCLLVGSTGYNWEYPILCKSRVPEIIPKFKKMAELQCVFPIKSLQLDNALDYVKLIPLALFIGTHVQIVINRWAL